MSDWRNINNLLSRSSVVYSGRLIGYALRFVLEAALGRLLGPAGYGTYTIGFTIAQTTQTVLTSGLDQGIIRFLPKFDDNSRFIRTVVLSVVLITTPVTLLLFFFAPSIAQVIGVSSSVTPVKVFILSIPLYCLTITGQYIARGFQWPTREIFIWDVFQTVANLGLLLLFANWSVTVLQAAIAYFLAILLSTSVAMLYAMQAGFSMKYELISRDRLKEYVIFSIPISGMSIFSLLGTQAILLVISSHAGSHAVGIYSSALKITIGVTLPLKAIKSMYMTEIAAKIETDHFGQLRSLHTQVTLWSVLLSFPAFLLMVGRPMMLLGIFGQEFQTQMSATILQALSTASFMMILCGVTGPTLRMGGFERLDFLNTAVFSVIKIVLTLVIIDDYGLSGVAIAIGVVLVLANVVEGAEIYYIYGLYPFDGTVLRSIPIFVVLLGIPLLFMNLDAVYVLELMVYPFLVWAFVFGENERSIVLHLLRRNVND